jgi:hypothetical protein
MVKYDFKVLKAGLLAGFTFAIIDLLLSLILISAGIVLSGVNLFEFLISLDVLLRLGTKPIIGLVMGIFFFYFEERIPMIFKSQKFSKRANKAASLGLIVGSILFVLSFIYTDISTLAILHIALWPALFGFFVNKFCK